MAGIEGIEIEIRNAEFVLAAWLGQIVARGIEGVAVDRVELVSHAYLSALVQQWPSLVPSRLPALVEATVKIRRREPDRFLRQRRLALAYLAERLVPGDVAAAPSASL